MAPDPHTASRSRIGLVVWIVLLVSIGLRSANTIGKGGGDFRGYVEVGELVLEGKDPYATLEIGTNTWPPLFSVLAVPLALGARAAPTVNMAVWVVLMAACVYGCLYFAILLVYRRPLTLGSRPGAISVTSAAALVPALLTWRYVLQNFRWLQINPLILLLALAGCYMIVRYRQRLGGGLVGASSAIKVMPVLFVPYFALKRWWPATLGALISGALLSVAPALVFGPAGLLAYTRTWVERTASIPIPVAWGSHSLLAMVDRFVGHRVLANLEPLSSDVELSASGDSLVTLIALGLVVGLVVVFVAAARRSGRDPASPGATIEFATLLVMIPLLSPTKSWTYYFIYTLLAHVVLWRAVSPQSASVEGENGLTKKERGTLRWLLAVSVVLGLLESASVVGSYLARRTQMLSLLTFSALTLVAALAYLHWLLTRRGGRAPESQVHPTHTALPTSPSRRPGPGSDPDAALPSAALPRPGRPR